VLFIAVKAPHFVRFNADRDVFMRFQAVPVHILYFFFVFFNSGILKFLAQLAIVHKSLLHIDL
jgi:hypothetical protein